MRTDDFQPDERPGAPLADCLIVALAILAPALGGATKLWSQAIVVLGCAVLLVWAPPRRWPLRWLLLPFIGLVLLSAVSFLPSAWFPTPPWRQGLVLEQRVELPGTLSPQPWMTLENTLLLLAALLWGAFLATRQWALKRSALLAVYVGGITLLAVLSLLFYAFDYQLPFWEPHVTGFGFFPNRNQTGNVLALGAIMTLALALHGINRQRRGAPAWIAACLIIALALMVNGSRGGITIFFLGSLAWLLWVWSQTRLMGRIGLGLAGVFLLLTLFSLFGGKTFERFLPKQNQGVYQLIENRARTQSDALALLREASWHGIGLGNFNGVFARYREAGLAEDRAIHPESDWLWVGVELGWLAPVLILAAVLYWFIKYWPRSAQPNFFLRSAIAVCALGFLLHGLVDVSGHRVGAVWPAIFLLSLLRIAEPETVSEKSAQVRSGAGFQPAARVRRFFGKARFQPAAAGIGIVFGGVAVWWLGSSLELLVGPTSARVEWLRAKTKEALEWKADERAAGLSSEALRYAPLDWQFYYYRALAEVNLRPTVAEALADFRRALYLEPNNTVLPFVEGTVWLDREPRLALAAWNETLRLAVRYDAAAARPGTGKRAGLYQQILALAGGYPELRTDLIAFTVDDPELLMVFLAQGTPEEIKEQLAKWLAADPPLKSLTEEQRKTFFAWWAKTGDGQLLEERLQANPDWLGAGWFWLAQAMAGRAEYQPACELAKRWAQAPVLPAVRKQVALPELRTDFLMFTNDFTTGFALYQAQVQAQEKDDALLTIQRVTQQPQCPKYFHYLEAQLLTEQQAWSQAWQAWRRFGEK
jgi:hypothetical protein